MTTNGKGHGADDAVAPENTTLAAIDFATSERQRRAEASLIARFALAGHAVNTCRSGDYVVSKWGLTRYCENFEALQAFARQIGVT